jgi:hypothetical protein
LRAKIELSPDTRSCCFAYVIQRSSADANTSAARPLLDLHDELLRAGEVHAHRQPRPLLLEPLPDLVEPSESDAAANTCSVVFGLAAGRDAGMQTSMPARAPWRKRCGGSFLAPLLPFLWRSLPLLSYPIAQLLMTRRERDEFDQRELPDGRVELADCAAIEGARSTTATSLPFPSRGATGPPTTTPRCGSRWRTASRPTCWRRARWRRA